MAAPPGPVTLDQINDADRAELKRLAKDCRVVIDVGTFLGGSAEAMLEAMPADGILLTLDIFEGASGTQTEFAYKNPAAIYAYATARLSRFGGRCCIGKGRSVELAKTVLPGIADLVFIDAAHDYANCLADIHAWLPKVKADGWMAGHDFDQLWAVDMDQKEITRRSEQDWDAESGAHCGVIRAVMDSFAKVEHAPDQKSSIWRARPQWHRQFKQEVA